MECTHCKKWHWKGFETCNAPDRPKVPVPLKG